MSKPIIAYYKSDFTNAVQALSCTVAALGYAIHNANNDSGVVTFETAPTWKTLRGRSMSAHVSLTEPGIVMLTVGGHAIAGGHHAGVEYEGEVRNISRRLIKELGNLLPLDAQRTGSLDDPKWPWIVIAITVLLVGTFVWFASSGTLMR